MLASASSSRKKHLLKHHSTDQMTMTDDVPTYIWAKMDYSTVEDASDDSETDDLTCDTDDDDDDYNSYDFFIDCNNANYSTSILNNRLQLLIANHSNMMYCNRNSSSYDRQCIKEDITYIKQMIRQNWEEISGHTQVTTEELEQMKLMVHDMLKNPELLYLSPLYSSSINSSRKEDTTTKKMMINTTTSTTASSQVSPMSLSVNDISLSLQSMQIMTPTTPPTNTGHITSGMLTPVPMTYLCRECSPSPLTWMDKPRMILLKTVPLPY
jgi:hypothetical protein